jgi:hypothetical protein
MPLSLHSPCLEHHWGLLKLKISSKTETKVNPGQKQANSFWMQEPAISISNT